MKNKLINCLVEKANIEICFNKEQWANYRRNEKSLLQICLEKDNSYKFELDLNKYRKYLNFGIVFAIAYFLMTVPAYAATGVAGMESLGETFVSLIQTAGYWICFAKALIDIIKEVLKGGDKAEGIGKILVKYVLAFSSFYVLPMIFNIIKSNFA